MENVWVLAALSGQAAAQIKRARLLRWILPAEGQLGREN